MTNGRAKIDYSAFVKEDRVHGRVYTDPDIFEEELDNIFYRGWVYVGHASEIPQPGDFRVTTIGRQSVIMVRADDGQVQVLMNGWCCGPRRRCTGYRRMQTTLTPSATCRLCTKIKYTWRIVSSG